MKITRPGEATRPVPRGAPPRRKRAAAIERSMNAYVQLDCGHFTDRDTIIAEAVFAPRRGVYHCSTCEKWKPRKKPPKPPPLPDEPMF